MVASAKPAICIDLTSFHWLLPYNVVLLKRVLVATPVAELSKLLILSCVPEIPNLSSLFSAQRVPKVTRVLNLPNVFLAVAVIVWL